MDVRGCKRRTCRSPCVAGVTTVPWMWQSRYPIKPGWGRMSGYIQHGEKTVHAPLLRAMPTRAISRSLQSQGRSHKCIYRRLSEHGKCTWDLPYHLRFGGSRWLSERIIRARNGYRENECLLAPRAELIKRQSVRPAHDKVNGCRAHHIERTQDSPDNGSSFRVSEVFEPLRDTNQERSK